MRKAIYILAIAVIVAGCELFVIGSKKTPPVSLDQTTPLGAVYLFKAELDSNNIPAATQILANPEGRIFLAYERYELYDEIARIGRILSKKPITKVITDSLKPTSYKFDIQFDYLDKFTFSTEMIDSAWYIIRYMEID